jgi:hypothetical protein
MVRLSPEAERKGYAVLAVVALLMFVNFYLFISPHPTSAKSYTANNGTVIPIKQGEVAILSGDARSLIVFDLFAFLGVWAYSFVNLIGKLKTNAN